MKKILKQFLSIVIILSVIFSSFVTNTLIVNASTDSKGWETVIESKAENFTLIIQEKIKNKNTKREFTSQVRLIVEKKTSTYVKRATYTTKEYNSLNHPSSIQAFLLKEYSNNFIKNFFNTEREKFPIYNAYLNFYDDRFCYIYKKNEPSKNKDIYQKSIIETLSNNSVKKSTDTLKKLLGGTDDALRGSVDGFFQELIGVEIKTAFSAVDVDFSGINLIRDCISAQKTAETIVDSIMDGILGNWNKIIKYSITQTKDEAFVSYKNSLIELCNLIFDSCTNYKISNASYIYDGKTKKPNVTVKDSNGKTLKEKTNYTVTYDTGRKNVGTYKVIIKLKGKYKGTETLTFKINPVKTTVSKLTAGKKSIKVAIKKQSSQVTGYEVQYSTSKKFTNAKSKTIASYKTTTTTLTKLSAKKTYYVRVRTYKTVDGKKYYSDWSTYKYKKTQ